MDNIKHSVKGFTNFKGFTSTSQNDDADCISKEVVWCWKENHVQISMHNADEIFGDPDNCCIKYDSDSNRTLEAAYQYACNTGEFQCDCDLGNGNTVNFLTAKQINSSTGDQKEVKRFLVKKYNAKRDSEPNVAKATTPIESAAIFAKNANGFVKKSYTKGKEVVAQTKEFRAEWKVAVAEMKEIRAQQKEEEKKEAEERAIRKAKERAERAKRKKKRTKGCGGGGDLSFLFGDAGIGVDADVDVDVDVDADVGEAVEWLFSLIGGG